MTQGDSNEEKDAVFIDGYPFSPRQAFDLEWVFSSLEEQKAYLLACFASGSPPPANTMARDAFDRVEALARATIAHRVLSAALELTENATHHAHRVLDEAEIVRGELARADVAWQQAEAIARGIMPDLAHDEAASEPGV